MARFKLNDKEYPIPGLEELTLGEQIILHSYSGITIDQIGEMKSPGAHPGVVGGLLHVAIQRADATLTDREIREAVLGCNFFKLADDVIEDEEAEPSPPSVPPSDANKSDSATTSGGDSTSVSAAPQPVNGDQSPTGQPLSDTSARSA